jgi:hypothetical protein
MANHVKPRSAAQTAISVSLTKELLARIDARAGALGLARSRYIAVLAQQDIEKSGPLTIAAEDEPEPTAPIELTPAALDFLKLAVPALTQYQDTHGQCPTPNVPEVIADSELWDYFLTQREQILKDKWIQSRNAGYDIGMERAIRDWLQKNQDRWAIPQDDAEAPPDSPPPP